MKKIIEELNLPKQILDKTERFMVTIFGPSAKEIGELMADKIRFRRMKNQIDIFKKTIKLLEVNNLEAKELKLKTLIPLIESSSLEEDEVLQEKWANLIASISSSPENGLEPKLVKTLSNLSVLEAKVLDYIYKAFLKRRKLKFEEKKSWANIKSEEEIKTDSVLIIFRWVKEHFNLSNEFAEICIENLNSLGLIKFEDPEIEISNDSFDPELITDTKGEQSIDFDLDVKATVSQSFDFYLTAYGIYFIRQCQLEIK